MVRLTVVSLAVAVIIGHCEHSSFFWHWMLGSCRERNKVRILRQFVQLGIGPAHLDVVTKGLEGKEGKGAALCDSERYAQAVVQSGYFVCMTKERMDIP